MTKAINFGEDFAIAAFLGAHVGHHHQEYDEDAQGTHRHAPFAYGGTDYERRGVRGRVCVFRVWVGLW